VLEEEVGGITTAGGVTTAGAGATTTGGGSTTAAGGGTSFVSLVNERQPAVIAQAPKERTVNVKRFLLFITIFFTSQRSTLFN
jgi:hypothetical protein